MRKSLLMGGAALVAFALVFGACDGSGYDVTATENIPSLSGPGNLKAVNDQEGVITLTWDPVYDAAGYEVWRKTGEEPAVKLTKSSNKLFPTEVNRFDDIISNTNVLKVNTAYTYTVVAVSSTSTKVPRGIEVVQNGTSSVTIPADQVTKISATTYTVPQVTGLAAAQVTLPDGNKVVRVSWDKNPNPGVEYRGKLADGQTFSRDNVELSPDGTKVVYDYQNQYPSVSLVDGETYSAEVTAYFTGDYYKAAAPAEVKYTHSDPSIISKFQVNSVQKQDASYEVSLSWEEKTPATNYKLYVHKYDTNSSHTYSEWTEVTNFGTPTSVAGIKLRTLRLTGANVPPYRQQWIYKLVALDANHEEIGYDTSYLQQDAWSSSPYVTLSFDTSGTYGGKTLKFVASASSSTFIKDEKVEFYAVPQSYTGVEYDTILANAIPIGSLAKVAIESGTQAERTVTKTLDNAGQYQIRAFVQIGTGPLTEINYYVYGSNYGPSNNWYYSVATYTYP